MNNNIYFPFLYTVPSAPLNFKITERQQTQLSMNWSRPESILGTFVGYTLEATILTYPDEPPDFEQTKKILRLDFDTVQYQLMDLEPYSRILLNLYALNANSLGFSVGQGTPATIIVRTLPGGNF
ncbi:unnamed protein product [Protopolystoma xenopodis]|uniref:Fibronectin type-III domain-containing protein n=1 Tax=Protopolystoma xenopodis TaxID=117903 RepID=A0A448WT13_9PLAT|nr:unnamed protein product [Protopolystoma xenopodis]